MAYRTALERAWLDGVITFDEARMLDSLREHLNISEEEHWSLENEIKARGPDPGIQEYKTALEQAWMDGLLTEMEKDMLCRLRDKYEITEDIHKVLEKRVKTGLGLDREHTPSPVKEILNLSVDPGASEVVTDRSSDVFWINEGKKKWNSNAQSEEDRTEAMKCFDRALRLNPKNHLAWTYKGAINKKMGYPEEALACYDRAIELRNDFIASWYNKGVLLAQGSISGLEEAIRCFDEVLRINPHNELAMRDRDILMNIVSLSLETKKPGKQG